MKSKNAPLVVFIVGASRGIGRELARQYAAGGDAVHALVRRLSTVEHLVAEYPTRLTVHALDVLNSSQLDALAADLDAHRSKIDLLVHVAGVNEGSFALQRRVNAEAPFAVANALLPALLRSSYRRIAIVTSDLGRASWLKRYRKAKKLSVERCRDDSICAYGMTKQLANQRFRELERGWRERGVTAVAVQYAAPTPVGPRILRFLTCASRRGRPGYVATDMNRGKGPVTPSESARGIRSLLAHDSRAALAGRFLDYAGKELSWE